MRQGQTDVKVNQVKGPGASKSFRRLVNGGLGVERRPG